MRIRIYDSPEYIDRYTVVIDRAEGSQEFYAMSRSPSHPQGFNQFCGTSQDGYFEGPHLGKPLKQIPECIRSAVELRARPK